MNECLIATGSLLFQDTKTNSNQSTTTRRSDTLNTPKQKPNTPHVITYGDQSNTYDIIATDTTTTHTTRTLCTIYHPLYNSVIIPSSHHLL